MYSQSTTGVNTRTLPIPYTKRYMVVGTTVQDFADGYITTVSTLAQTVSTVQYRTGGWSETSFASGVYLVTIGY